MLDVGAKADFGYAVLDQLVLIVDRDEGGRSVTNDAEAVLAEISRLEGITFDRHLIAYRDSSGRWDGMNTENGKFAGFFPLDQDAAASFDLVYEEFAAA